MYSRVYVEITNICNMNCSFCHGHNRSHYMITEEQFKHILSALKDKTKYIYYHLMGEPLLHPKLPEFIGLSKEQGFNSIVTTNGTLLPRVGDKLIENGIHKVNISVHSFEEDNIDKMKSYLDDIICFVNKASKASVIVVLRFWNNGAEGVDNNGAISYLKSNLKSEWVENSKGYRIYKKVFLEFADRFKWPDKDAEFQSDSVFCYGLRDHFGILCDGTVVPCCLDSDGIINLGNIYTDNLNEILNSDRTKAIRDGFSCRKATEELCKRCAYAQRF